jgi:hypothetical protein
MSMVDKQLRAQLAADAAEDDEAAVVLTALRYSDALCVLLDEITTWEIGPAGRLYASEVRRVLAERLLAGHAAGLVVPLPEATA